MQVTDSPPRRHASSHTAQAKAGGGVLSLCVRMRTGSEELRRAANGSNIQGPEPSGHARMLLCRSCAYIHPQREEQQSRDVARQDRIVAFGETSTLQHNLNSGSSNTK